VNGISIFVKRKFKSLDLTEQSLNGALLSLVDRVECSDGAKN
jgi:hypothetical protein